jgi:hypothetical protein
VAGNYDILSMQRVVQLVGGTDVVDAEQVMVQTIPSGVVFPLLFAPNEATPTFIAPLAEKYAAELEIAMAAPSVGAIQVVQDTNAANQLIDTLELTAISTSGRSSKVLNEPYVFLDAKSIIQVCDAARAQLDAIEAL